MCDHRLQCSTTCAMYVCIPVLWGFWRCQFLPEADQKWQIPRYCKFLTRIHLVKQYFYWILDIIHRLHFFLIPHQVSGCYLALPNVELIDHLHKRLVCIYHHHIFRPLYPLVVHGCGDYFLEGAVHVFYKVIVVEIVLVFSVCNVDVDMCGFEEVSWLASRFSWWYKCNMWV